MWKRMSDTARCLTVIGGIVLLVVAAGLAAWGGYVRARDIGRDGGLSQFTGDEREAARIAKFQVFGCSDEPAIHRWAWEVTDVELLGGTVSDQRGNVTPAFRAKVRSYNLIGIPTGTVGVEWTAEGHRPSRGSECTAPNW